MTDDLLPRLTATILAGLAVLRRKKAGDAPRSAGSREILAEMLEANLVNLDSVMRGFAPARAIAVEPAERPAVSPTRIEALRSAHRNGAPLPEGPRSRVYGFLPRNIPVPR